MRSTNPLRMDQLTSFSYWPRAVCQRQIRIRYLPKPSGESGALSSSHIRKPLHKLGTPGSPVHERLCAARRTDAGKNFPTADLTMVESSCLRPLHLHVVSTYSNKSRFSITLWFIRRRLIASAGSYDPTHRVRARKIAPATATAFVLSSIWKSSVEKATCVTRRLPMATAQSHTV